MKSLSARQFEVMDIFWKTQEPMIASQIVDADKDLNINTVQAVLKSLIKKNMIKVDNIVHSGTVLARSYRPIVSKNEYIQALCNSSHEATDSSDSIIAFVKQEKSIKVLEELEKAILEAKEKLKG